MLINRFVWYIARALLIVVACLAGAMGYLYALGAFYPQFEGSGNSVYLFIVAPLGALLSAASAVVIFIFRRLVLPECPACKGALRQTHINSPTFECTQCAWGKEE